MIKLKPDDGENVVEDMFGNKVDWSTMTVTEITEHEDGSATIMVDMSSEQVKMFMDIMMRSAMVMYLRQTEGDTKDGIKQATTGTGQKAEGKATRTPANRRPKAAAITTPKGNRKSRT